MEKELRQLFKNRADAYLNTIDESVEQGMSGDRFIETINEALDISRVSNRRELLVDFLDWFKNYCDLDVTPNEEDVDLFLSN